MWMKPVRAANCCFLHWGEAFNPKRKQLLLLPFNMAGTPRPAEPSVKPSWEQQCHFLVITVTLSSPLLSDPGILGSVITLSASIHTLQQWHLPGTLSEKILLPGGRLP